MFYPIHYSKALSSHCLEKISNQPTHVHIFHVADFSNGNIIIYATPRGIKSLNTTSNESCIVRNETVDYTALNAANGYIYYAILLSGNEGSICKTPFFRGDSKRITTTGEYKKI